MGGGGSTLFLLMELNLVALSSQRYSFGSCLPVLNDSYEFHLRSNRFRCIQQCRCVIVRDVLDHNMLGNVHRVSL
jgi:hypothetical protein